MSVLVNTHLGTCCFSTYFRSLLYCFRITFLQSWSGVEILFRRYKSMHLSRAWSLLKHLQEITSVSESEFDKDKSQINVWTYYEGKIFKGAQVKNIICCRSTKSFVAAASKLLAKLDQRAELLLWRMRMVRTSLKARNY